MEALAGILLEMQAFDPHGEAGAVVTFHQDLALADNGILELADLVALGQVGIEIVLPVEPAGQIDLRPQAQPGADGLLDAESVQDRQHARHGCVHQADLRIGACPKADGCAGEELGLGGHLGVDLKSQDDFPRPGPALDQFGCFAHAPCLDRASSLRKPLALPASLSSTSGPRAREGPRAPGDQK